jgi:hypothetical protein
MVGLELYGVYLPSPWLMCVRQLMESSVLSGSLSSLWPTSFALFPCPDFGPCLLFFFLSLSRVHSFYKVW